MALTVSVTAGKQFAETEKITVPKLNQLGSPTVTVTGTLDNLDDFNLTPTPATTGQGLYWDNGNSEFRVTDDVSGQRILGIYVKAMQGATAVADGVQGVAPQPLIADRDAVLHGDGTYRAVTGTIGNDLYNNENFY